MAKLFRILPARNGSILATEYKLVPRGYKFTNSIRSGVRPGKVRQDASALDTLVGFLKNEAFNEVRGEKGFFSHQLTISLIAAR